MNNILLRITYAFGLILCTISVANAQTVFSIGTGQMPDPFSINVMTDPDLNPAANLQAMSSFNDKGAWTASTSYQAGDVVTVNGVKYVVTSQMTSGASFAADVAAGNFVLYGIASDSFYNGARFLSVGSYSNSGVWSTNTAYSIGDKVTHMGVSYIASENHTSGTFAIDSNAGYWVLSSTAPTLSDYNAPAPVNGMCEDFDTVFNSGSSTYSLDLSFFTSDLNNTGTDLDGKLTLSLTFDWENEALSGAGNVTLTSFPANNPGGASFALASTPSKWTAFSFHTGNKCGKFKIAHINSGYSLPNQTCFSSTMLSFYAVVQFYEKSGKFLPVVHVHPIGESHRVNDLEFYNSIFNDNGCSANTREHYGKAIGGHMTVQ